MFYIVIGIGVVLLALLFPPYSRRQGRRRAREELLQSLSRRDPEEVLAEIDAAIQEGLARYARLEENAGSLSGAGGDELLHQVHRELVLLKQNREVVLAHMQGRSGEETG